MQMAPAAEPAAPNGARRRFRETGARQAFQQNYMLVRPEQDHMMVVRVMVSGRREVVPKSGPE